MRRRLAALCRRSAATRYLSTEPLIPPAPVAGAPAKERERAQVAGCHRPRTREGSRGARPPGPTTAASLLVRSGARRVATPSHLRCARRLQGVLSRAAARIAALEQQVLASNEAEKRLVDHVAALREGANKVHAALLLLLLRPGRRRDALSRRGSLSQAPNPSAAPRRRTGKRCFSRKRPDRPRRARRHAPPRLLFAPGTAVVPASATWCDRCAFCRVDSSLSGLSRRDAAAGG